VFAAFERYVPAATSSAAQPKTHLRSDDFRLEDALATVGGDRELLLRVVDVFLDTWPELVAAAESAAARGAAGELREAAARAKEAVANFGAAPAMAAAQRLEEEGAPASPDDAAGLVRELRDSMARLADALRRFRSESA
jgi:protein-histidine pros-kinase